MKRLILFNIIGMILLIGLISGGVYLYYQAQHFVKMDDRKVTADMAAIAVPASGTLTDWTLNEGSTVNEHTEVGHISGAG